MRQADPEFRAIPEAAYAAINSGDLDGLLALVDEDVEFESLVAEVEGTTFRGREGVRAWWDTVRGAFDEVRWELLDVLGEAELGVVHFRMVGKLSGVAVEQMMWQGVRVRERKVVWWAVFRTEREALEAVELTD